ncbi:MAG: AMP-binding protein, partial [Chromatiales bacterium]|nr:AMP-binding protein [Chromatiales bacterium]
MNKTSPFEFHLDKNDANYAPLTPLSFIERAAAVYPDQCSIIYGDLRYTWQETYQRCRRLASALQARGVERGDTVAILAPNVPAMFEASFGVAMAGAILNTLNTRLDADIIAFSLDHGEAKVLIVDKDLSALAQAAVAKANEPPLVIDIDDPQATGQCIGALNYEALLAEGDPRYDWQGPSDEWDAMSLNYTSGTTGNPKGVVYHHRGSYLNAVSNAVGWNLGHHPVYLWTLPLFHCNGWCFPWTLAAVAGTSICTRKVDAPTIFDAIADHGVTHFCGAPIVLGLILNATDDERRPFDHTVEVMTAASPPPPSVLEAMEDSGFR